MTASLMPIADANKTFDAQRVPCATSAQLEDWLAGLMGRREVMSDLEHDIILQTRVLSSEAAWVSDIAERALRAAIDAQELAIGRHDGWMDTALRHIETSCTQQAA